MHQFAPKPLLVFAHKREARFFLQNGSYQKREFSGLNIYEGENYLIIFTGQGGNKVVSSLESLLKEYGGGISQIINLGICGAINRSLEIGKLYRVGKIFYGDNFLDIKSNRSGSEISCRTVNSPLLPETVSTTEKTVNEDVVDMESFFVGSLAEEYGIEFSCYKLVSDFAGDSEKEKIKKAHSLWSENIYRQFINPWS